MGEGRSRTYFEGRIKSAVSKIAPKTKKEGVLYGLVYQTDRRDVQVTVLAVCAVDADV